MINAEIEDLTKQILHKELEWEKLNLVFRRQTTLVSPWCRRRLFAYGFGNAALTEAGLLLSLPTEYQISNEKPHPHQKNVHTGGSQRSDLAAANRLALIANSYNAGGDLFELSLNVANYCSLKKQGMNPSAYQRKAHQLHAQVDHLIERRSLALTSVSDFTCDDKAIALAEGRLLSDLRDLYLLEYLDYYAGCKKFWLVQNVAYLTDFVKCYRRRSCYSRTECLSCPSSRYVWGLGLTQFDFGNDHLINTVCRSCDW